MTNRFDNLIEGFDEQNIVLYSAHDVTLNGMLHLLGIRDQADARPPYGASLNLELHENSKIKSDYEVKVSGYTIPWVVVTITSKFSLFMSLTLCNL